MKKIKVTLSCITTILFLMNLAVPVFATDRYTGTFAIEGGNATITIYETQDTSNGSEGTSAIARDGDTGEILTNGEGQINFTVNPEEGYSVAEVTASGNYKNIKSISGTTYRITKITGDLTITIKLIGEAPDEEGEPVITFSDEKATLAGNSSGVTINGTSVTVSAAGTYTFKGICSDGNILVAKNSGEVELVFDGLNLTSKTTAPVVSKGNTDVKIKAQKDSENVLADTNRNGESPKSCINSSDKLSFRGKGTLTVNGNNKNGIKADGKIEIDNLTLNVTAVDNCIAADNVLTIYGGTIECTSETGDCLKSDPAEITDNTAGDIVISDGTITLNAKSGDGIQAQNSLVINGGTFDIAAGGGSSIKLNKSEDLSCKGIKSGNTLTVTGGTFNIDTADDATHSGNTATISGSEFCIHTGDDAFHADKKITISGSKIDIKNCYEGLEALDIIIDSGEINIVASDDGININGGNDMSGMRPRPGKKPEENKEEPGSLVINGGIIIIDSNGDGLDSNGSIEMNGGTVIINGPTSNIDGAIDYDKTFTMKGGTLIAVGSSGMAQSISAGTQAAVMFKTNSTLSAGEVVCIKDNNGNMLAAFETSKNFSSVVFSSNETEKGSKYTLVSGGSVSGDSIGGLYTENATYSGGEEVSTSEATTEKDGSRPGRRPETSGGFFDGIINFLSKIIGFFKTVFSYILGIFD